MAADNVNNSTDFALSAKEVVQATHGKLLGGDESAVFEGVGIDSRTVAAGQLFVAIEGERHDGHKFMAEVIERGVNGVVIDATKAPGLKEAISVQPSVGCVAVKNTTRALGDLAAHQRRRSRAVVIGITGSNGKTTTRRMIATILRRHFETLASRGSYNNDIGLPLTLLKLNAGHQRIVLELGMNHFSEIRRLAEICRPDIGIITCIAPCHLEGVGSIQGVVKAKAEIIEHMPVDGTIVLNGDDPHLAQLGAQFDQRALYFGESADADIGAEGIRISDDGMHFTLRLPESRQQVSLPTTGRFMVTNALAAAAAGYLSGISGGDIARGLSHFEPVTGRLNVIRLPRNITLVDDTYNANPGSMAAAIETLAGMAANERSILVVGDMLELGDEAVRLHREVGELIGRSGITRLFATGKHANEYADGAVAKGMDNENILVGEKEVIIARLKTELTAGDCVLVKGSRGSAMESIVEPLKLWVSQPEGKIKGIKIH